MTKCCKIRKLLYRDYYATVLFDLEFDVRFNPDSFNEEVRHAECEV